MKVIYIHQFFTTPRGTGGTRSYELAKRMVAAGHEVTVLCGSLLGGDTGLSGPFSGGRREGVVDGIKVIEFELPYHNEHSFVRRAFTFAKYGVSVALSAIKLPADLIFATSPPLTVAVPAFLVRMLTQRKIVIEIRDPWPESPQAMGVITSPFVLAGMRVLAKMLYGAADHAIALSPGIADILRQSGFSGDRITLVPNGSDFVAQVSGTSKRLTDAPTDCLVALYAGTHGIANGLDAVLDAARELKRRKEQRVRIVLCGAGQKKQELRTMATAEKLDNIFFMDPVPKSEVSQLIAGADIGLQILMDVPVFYYGTSPNKFFDYIANGLPVLTNYPGWVADMIKENNCGYAVPAQNAAAFADALQHARSNLAVLKSMGENAKMLALRDFDRDALAKRLIDCLESQVPETAERKDV
jgi:glycosyltransferase involved in cell wall biosynthesis